MANITISDLRPAGADLFSDSESYMHELTGDELTTLQGLGWSAFYCQWGKNQKSYGICKW
jgi:hypothetical protein